LTQTLVTFVLDKSGSMASCFDATVEAFNAYIKELKNGGEDIAFSLIQFDSVSIETTWKNAPISDVTGLSRDNYQPRGSTPLIDAAYKAIKATEKRAAELTDPKVIVCIQTDGQENDSRQYTWAQLNDLIKEKTAQGWQFNFMGVGIDAYTQASLMGLSASQTMAYDASDLAATRQAFAASGANTRLYASGARGSTTYSTEQKMAAGDKFDAAAKAGGAADAVKPQKSAWTSPKPKKAIVDDIDL
jgi:uncharacterized protein YegL